MLNDPYYGGTHHADWTVMKPVFFEGKPVLFPSVRAHMADCGGPVAGGYNPEATDVWQEALRIPPIKLFEKGVLRQDVLDWITDEDPKIKGEPADKLKAALDEFAATYA